MKNKLYEKALTVIDKMQLSKGYYPTVAELKKHYVEENFEALAPFLLYLSESLAHDDTDYTLEQKEEIKELKRFIQNLFTEKLED